jgi:CRP-like cAMP-binding protein/Fe-S-cluster-containing hydrogenase component 2/thioredoxin reductase
MNIPVIETVEIAIVGAGPGGLSAAAHAADLGVRHVLLEAEAHLCHTIYQYQRGKHVMAEPHILPLRSPLSFAAGQREAILATWEDEIRAHAVNVRLASPVTAIQRDDAGFSLTTPGGIIQAQRVILAIGVQGNLRRLGVEGDDDTRVQLQLADPGAYIGETIVVVGAGDAAIENALALAPQNQVILINRNEEFTRCKDGNLKAVLGAVAEGRINCRFGTTASAVRCRTSRATDAGEMLEAPLAFDVKTPEGPDTIDCDRIIARLGATPPRRLVEGFGVMFPSADPAALPTLSSTYESSVPGLYIIGALAGYPLIKQAMNQGYEVVEHALGRRVEPADEALLAERLKRFSRSLTVSEILAIVQKHVPLLANVNPLQLREFMLDAEISTPNEGDAIFQRNDYTNSFYMIVSGRVTIEFDDPTAATRTVTLEQGQFFGELGLISGRRRSSTVRAGPACALIEAPRRAMLKLMATAESVRRAVDEVFLKRAVRTYLAPMLSEFDLDELLTDGVELRRYGGGDVLFSEGDVADGLYLIRRGSVMVTRELAGRNVVLSYLAAGNYVGEMALLTESARTATVQAAVNVEAIVLAGPAFKRVLGRNPRWRAEMETRFMERLRVNAAMEAAPAPGNIIQFLLQQGVGEATDVLLIDESLCIRCDNCEKACADTHAGTSRLDREAGPTYANLHVPTSCRHCEHPHCMKECPPDAIHRSANGEVFINDTCIGCGNCEKNCPYGVIQMAPVDPDRKPPNLLAWLLFGLGTEPGREAPAKEKSLAKKAVKCDMCQGVKGGAACVRACPTGAALRVRPEEFMSVATR